MLKQERHNFILDEIQTRKRVLSVELSNQLQTSEDTIRRDLHELAAAGQLLKVHGGALAVSPSKGNSSQTVIAQKAASLISSGMLVFMSGGELMKLVAEYISPEVSITIITFDLHTALALNKYTNLQIIIIGGQLSSQNIPILASQQIHLLQEVRADLCLIAAEAISDTRGLTAKDWELAQTQKAMINSATETIILCAHLQINTMHPIQICPLARLSTLITDLSPGDRRLDAYRSVLSVM